MSDTHAKWGGVDWFTNRPGHPMGGWKTTAKIQENIWVECSIVGSDARLTLFVKPKTVMVYGYPCGLHTQLPGESRPKFAARIAGVFKQVVSGLSGELE